MIDLLIVAAFVIYSVTVGLLSRKQASKDLTEYFLAGRSVSGTSAGFSMAATQSAADTPLLVMGLIAIGGESSLWRLWIYGLAFLLMGFVLGAAWRRSGVLTDAELVMTRYSARGALALRGLKAVYYGTVINCVVMAFVLVAAVRIFEIFLPWNAWLPSGLATAAPGLRPRAAGLPVGSPQHWPRRHRPPAWPRCRAGGRRRAVVARQVAPRLRYAGLWASLPGASVRGAGADA